MIFACNIVLILLAAFIAYWWANQGLFSSLLHLVCVVVAGAVAFAFWEPLTFGVLIKGSGFDDYAWGISFIGLFALSLFVLRLLMDKIAPANVKLPRWADLTFGGVSGAAAGVLTVGMFVIGAAFIPPTHSLMGLQG